MAVHNSAVAEFPINHATEVSLAELEESQKCPFTAEQQMSPVLLGAANRKGY